MPKIGFLPSEILRRCRWHSRRPPGRRGRSRGRCRPACGASTSSAVAVPGTTVTLQPTCTRQRRMFHFMPKSIATTWRFVGAVRRQDVFEPAGARPTCSHDEALVRHDLAARDRGLPCRARHGPWRRARHRPSRPWTERRSCAPRTRSRRTSARVSIPSMPTMLFVCEIGSRGRGC